MVRLHALEGSAFDAAFVQHEAAFQAQWRRWWLALWLALVTHPLLDAMTVYGTRLALPFSDHPYAVGSVFIVDPLYTLPLLAGAGAALALRDARRARLANAAGLAISTAYLGWGWAVQQHVEGVARASLAAQGIAAERLLVTPAPFNSLLWRIVAVDGERFLEGYHSLLDARPHVAFDAFDRGAGLLAEAAGIDAVQRVAAFSKGWYKLRQDGAQLLVSDLRMGAEPRYTFTFVVAERRSALVPLAPPRYAGERPELGRALPWLWRRMLGEPLPPPR